MYIQVDRNTLVETITSNGCLQNRSEAIKLIEEIDLSFAEVDFTISVITTLFKSLETDMTQEELYEFIDTLREDITSRL